MKTPFQRLMNLILILQMLCFCENAFAEKPFARALVMPGGGFNSTIFLGMYAALVEQGKKPDVILSACGGSIAAPIASALQDPQRIRSFVRSRAYFEAMQTVAINNGSVVSALKTVLGAMANRLLWNRSVPNLFEGTMLTVPENFLAGELPGFRQGFPSRGTHLVILASKAEFGPQDLRSSKAAAYRETAFTDPFTATYLQGAIAGPHRTGSGRGSNIEEQIEVDSATSVMDAARASIADPFYIAPKQIKGSYYLTGASDLYPLELAHDLAQEVLMPFPGKFDTFIEQNVFASIFGFSANKRLKEVRAEEADAWIDLSDTDSIYKSAGMNPSPDFLHLQIKLGLPTTFEEFQRRIDAQWSYGYERALEALAAPPGSKAHIRNR